MFRSLPLCVRRGRARRARMRASLIQDHTPIQEDLGDVLSETLITRLGEAP